MDLADAAAAARRAGETSRFEELTREALEQEEAAAHRFRFLADFEPTRSVLYRSAASLALDCNEPRRAEQLIAEALAGEPPADIADELRDLLENVYFRRHLQLRGVTLDESEFQMSLEGSAVGYGITRSDHLVQRVSKVESLLYRTAERRSERPYREAGRRRKKLSQELQLYVSTPRAASFAVTFRVGRGDQLVLPGMSFVRDVITDVLACLVLLDANRVEELRERIPDEAYFLNFLALAREVAPDGEEVRSVGFTTSTGETTEYVAMSRPRAVLPVGGRLDPEEQSQGHGELPVLIAGRLLRADALGETEGKISVVDAAGKEHPVQVPRGLMSDVVKPYFEEQVVIRARALGSRLILESIDPASETEGG
jgi:hypothetical protein